MSKKIIAAILAIFVIVSAIAYSQLGKKHPLGGATGIAAGLDTVTSVTVGKLNTVLLFSPTSSTSTPNQCSSRVISNPAQALLLRFGTTSEAVLGLGGRKGEPILTGTLGIVQAASTTVNYDSSVYGCGFVSALGMEASSSIMIMEFK